VSYENKNTVFRTRDKNSAISIMKLTKEWIETKPDQMSSTTPVFTCETLAGVSKTIGNGKIAY